MLKELYPNLSPINIKDNIEISKKEEIYLLRIPKTINPQHLLTKEFDLIQGSKLKINKEKFELEPTNKAPNPLLLVGNQSRIIQPKNSFFLKKYIKLSKAPDLQIIEKAMVPLPENLKARHPLFGSDYEEKIRLNENVESRLQKAIADCLKQEEKMKRKKKKKQSTGMEMEDIQNEVIFSLLDSHTTRRNQHNEEQYDSAFGSSESQNNSAKKKKNKRKSLDESGDKQSPTVVKKKKNKSRDSIDVKSILEDIKTEIIYTEDQTENHKDLIDELSIIDHIADQSFKKAKKKKEKKRRSSSFGEQSMFESTRIEVKMEVPDEGSPDESESKKQSIIDETLKRMKTELLTECDSDGDDNKKIKKKKKRKSHQEEEKGEHLIEMLDLKQEINVSATKKRERTTSVLEDDNNSEVVRKKTKKTKKNSSLNDSSLCLETELDSLLEKVKKAKKIKS